MRSLGTPRSCTTPAELSSLHAAVPRYPDLVTSYLVCATPRSGSTLLCEALAVTGVAGRPYEFFEALPATGVPRRPLD